MHADLTRWTHDPALAYRSVLLQQGRVLLDADWNEQAAITAHHDTARTADIVGADGGPAPLDGGPGPFAIVDLADGSEPAGVPWARLGVSPGHYYVDGVLVESDPDPDATAAAGAWALADQPHRPTIGTGGGASPGLEEPPAGDGDGRYAAYLDVFERTVSPDERPELLESALGGPDTAMRQQTAWQVQLSRLDAGEVCSQLDAVAERAPRTMVAALREAAADADPCQITSGGGYQRLENQLYRVEVCSVSPQPRFVWSRENGSVTAGLVQVGVTTEPGMDAALTLDRVGRDEELSIRQGDLVEVTSTDRQLRGLPGFLARVGPVIDLVIHVDWLAGAPAGVPALGRAPVVRRWDGGPSTLSTGPTDLEGGITVAFPAGGTPSVGDFWLVPARTARLAYGTSARQGTLDWPWDATTPTPRPPVGPVHHHAPLGILTRTGSAWTLESDCRHLFPPLTGLVTIDLVGGDGQEAMPGDELGAPVRVVVRNGGLPVEGAPVRFTPAGGTLREEVSGSPPAAGVVETGADGVAAVRWTLDPTGSPTQTLTAQRLDDTSTPVDVAVVVSGRLSIASQVQWDPACDAFSRTRTVQDALAQLAMTPTLRLLGGDGQEVSSEGVTVPQLVRVAVDSPCGPVEVKVVAQATDRALVLGSKDGADRATDADRQRRHVHRQHRARGLRRRRLRLAAGLHHRPQRRADDHRRRARARAGQGVGAARRLGGWVARHARRRDGLRHRHLLRERRVRRRRRARPPASSSPSTRSSCPRASTASRWAACSSTCRGRPRRSSTCGTTSPSACTRSSSSASSSPARTSSCGTAGHHWTAVHEPHA